MANRSDSRRTDPDSRVGRVMENHIQIYRNATANRCAVGARVLLAEIIQLRNAIVFVIEAAQS